MKILLKGHYGYGNLGDDVLMIVAYNLLKEIYPESTISIFSNNTVNNKDSKSPSGYNAYIHSLIRQNVDIVDWTFKGYFDLIVNGGGGLYFDRQSGPAFKNITNLSLLKIFGIHGLNNIEKIARVVSRKRLNITSRKRLGIGIGIGEYAKGSKRLTRDMSELGYYNYLWVRDHHSIGFLRRYRFQNVLKNYGDLAFLSAYWLKKQELPTQKSVKHIGIVLMNIHSGSINEELEKLINLKRSQGFTVSLFLFDQSFDQSILNSFPNEQIFVWEPNKISLKEFLRHLQKCQIMITLRAHGAIMASIMGIIPICIESSIKLREVSKMFPQSCRLFQLSASYQELSNHINHISDNYTRTLRNLKNDVVNNEVVVRQGLQSMKKYLA